MFYFCGRWRGELTGRRGRAHDRMGGSLRNAKETVPRHFEVGLHKLPAFNLHRAKGRTLMEDHEPGSRAIRWVCDCTHPPVLLAVYDESGRIEIKVRDRYYIAHDRLQAICPRCGARHVLDIRHPQQRPGETGAAF